MKKTHKAVCEIDMFEPAVYPNDVEVLQEHVQSRLNQGWTLRCSIPSSIKGQHLLVFVKKMRVD